MFLKELKLEITDNIIIPSKKIESFNQWAHYQRKRLGPISIVVNYFFFCCCFFKLKCLQALLFWFSA